MISWPHLLIGVAGALALAWQVIWQIRAALTLGASAWGAALTLAATMGGMSIGAAAAGFLMRNRTLTRPLCAYGALQIPVAACGWLLAPAIQGIERLDARWEGAFALSGALLFSVLAAPAAAMGATFPVMGLVARARRLSLASLYGINTLGASAGALLSAFLLIPSLGLRRASVAIAILNLVIAALAVLADHSRSTTTLPEEPQSLPSVPERGIGRSLFVVCVTGFALFVIEVAWFRSLIASFKASADAFAVMLACVLLALGAAGTVAPRLRRSRAALAPYLFLAGVLILLATPLIERFDYLTGGRREMPIFLIGRWFALTLLGMGAPIFFLGLAFPWIVEGHRAPRPLAWLYSANTLAAVAGALTAGWVLLPAIGWVRASWTAGLLVAGAGLTISPRDALARRAVEILLALVVAVGFESGLGRTRVQSGLPPGPFRPVRILRAVDGPDATIAAVETEGGFRLLLINGFMASVQAEPATPERDPTNYMRWMGHLPMLLHPHPRRALVICFGIGLTARAVLQEGPEYLEVVDIEPRVFDLADFFPANGGVLRDPRVRAVVADGRAFIRRASPGYDVITLEPMPPNFAGMNALYSREFYEAAREKLTEDGIMAQWLPFHLTPLRSAVSIARTFQSVFPCSALWVDPLSGTGILIGARKADTPLGHDLPGLQRTVLERNLTESQIRAAFRLDETGLARYAAPGRVITDDNQLLSYGAEVHAAHRPIPRIRRENIVWLKKVAGEVSDADDFRVDSDPNK